MGLPSGQLQAGHRPGERIGADRDIQLPVGNREAERDPTLEPGGERRDETAIDRVQIERRGPVNPLAGQPPQELIRILVRVDDDARRCLGRLVQPCGVRRPDLDPGRDRAGQVADGERPARSLVAPWPLPSDAQPASPLPPGVTQSLWIDTDSLLPLRWSISMPAMSGRGMPAIPDYGLSFTYDPSLDVRPPDGVARPDCVR